MLDTAASATTSETIWSETTEGGAEWKETRAFPVMRDNDMVNYQFDIHVTTDPPGLIDVDGPRSNLSSRPQGGGAVVEVHLAGKPLPASGAACIVTVAAREYGDTYPLDTRSHEIVFLGEQYRQAPPELYAARLANETRQAEARALAQQENERAERERAEEERIEKERTEKELAERELAAKELAAKELAEEIQRESAQKEQQRIEQQQFEQQKLEQQRLEAERIEQERITQLRIERQRAEQQQVEQQRAEQQEEDRRRQEAARIEAERSEQARQELLRQEHAKQEAAETARRQEESLRQEQERREEERLRQQRIELERQKQEQQEQERLEQQRSEQARLTRERLEQERQEEERQEEERQERLRREAERREEERLTSERLEEERVERQRLELERLELERERREEEARILRQEAQKRQERQEELEQQQRDQERQEQLRLEARRQEEEARAYAQMQAERTAREQQEQDATAATQRDNDRAATQQKATDAFKRQPEDVVFTITAQADSVQVTSSEPFIALWPGKKQRVWFEIVNNTGTGQQIALDLKNLVQRDAGPQVQITHKGGDPTIENGNTGATIYEMEAEERFQYGEYKLAGMVTGNDPSVAELARLRREISLPVRVKAAPAVQIKAGKIPRRWILEEAPTRCCLYALNTYTLHIENTGNAKTATRLEVTPEPPEARNDYDYVFDRQLVNVPYNDSVEVKLRVFHRENWGGIWSRSKFTVKAVPVTDGDDAAGANAPPIADAPTNARTLQTMKLQIPFWFIAGLLLMAASGGWWLFSAPDHLQITTDDPKISSLYCEKGGERYVAVVGDAQEQAGLRATAKWDARFFTLFSVDRRDPDQRVGVTWNQMPLTVDGGDKGEIKRRVYHVAPLLLPSFLGGRGLSQEVRYYYTRPDVSLRINGQPPPPDGHLHLNNVGKSNYVSIKLTNAGNPGVKLNCWVVSDKPKDFSDIQEYTENFTLINREVQTFGFKLQPKSPADAEGQLTLITSDARNPIIYIDLAAGK